MIEKLISNLGRPLIPGLVSVGTWCRFSGFCESTNPLECQADLRYYSVQTQPIDAVE